MRKRIITFICTVVFMFTLMPVGLAEKTCKCKNPNVAKYDILVPSECTKKGTEGGICQNCGLMHKRDVAALKHDWSQDNRTCTKGRTCTRRLNNGNICGAEKPNDSGKGHSWEDATCQHVKWCSVCHKPYNKNDKVNSNGHKAKDHHPCTEDARCRYCGQVMTKAPGHSYGSATCVSPSKCGRCGGTNPAAPNKNPNNHTNLQKRGESPLAAGVYRVTYYCTGCKSYVYRTEYR